MREDAEPHNSDAIEQLPKAETQAREPQVPHDARWFYARDSGQWQVYRWPNDSAVFRFAEAYAASLRERNEELTQDIARNKPDGFKSLAEWKEQWDIRCENYWTLAGEKVELERQNKELTEALELIRGRLGTCNESCNVDEYNLKMIRACYEESKNVLRGAQRKDS